MVVIPVFVISLLCIWLYPSAEDFMTSNRRWNGLKSFSREFQATSTDSLPDPSEAPEETALVAIPYLDYTDRELLAIERFVDGGGTLLLMDDYGYGNSVLAYLGVAARFTHESLLDPVFHDKNQSLPRITDFAPRVKENDVAAITLDHAATLTGVTDSEAIAWSSGTSFLDIDKNGTWEQDEPIGPFAVAAQVRLGRGTLALMADPSIIINGIIGRDDNDNFIRYLIQNTDVPRKVLVDSSHLTKSPLDAAKTRLVNIRQLLSNPYALVGIMAVIFLIVSRFTLEKGENIGKYQDNV
jgi:hypothetical protein